MVQRVAHCCCGGQSMHAWTTLVVYKQSGTTHAYMRLQLQSAGSGGSPHSWACSLARSSRSCCSSTCCAPHNRGDKQEQQLRYEAGLGAERDANCCCRGLLLGTASCKALGSRILGGGHGLNSR